MSIENELNKRGYIAHSSIDQGGVDIFKIDTGEKVVRILGDDLNKYMKDPDGLKLFVLNKLHEK